MRKTLFAAALVLLLSVSLSGAAAKPDHANPRSNNFIAPLSGGNEVPPVETRATGVAKFNLSSDGNSLEYKLIAANIEDVLMAHIHIGGPNENGPVVVWLYPEDGPPPMLIEGRFNGVLATGTITSDDLVGQLAGQSIEALLDEIESGNTYVNVHTSANPGGEIRGQIR